MPRKKKHQNKNAKGILSPFFKFFQETYQAVVNWFYPPLQLAQPISISNKSAIIEKLIQGDDHNLSKISSINESDKTAEIPTKAKTFISTGTQTETTQFNSSFQYDFPEKYYIENINQASQSLGCAMELLHQEKIAHAKLKGEYKKLRNTMTSLDGRVQKLDEKLQEAFSEKCSTTYKL